MSKHCHAQIEYLNEEKVSVESLVGFNPLAKDDREFVHALLDEFLDHLASRFDNNSDAGGEQIDARFIVFHGFES